eukprot:4862358-Prymnesium_polylepis.1
MLNLKSISEIFPLLFASWRAGRELVAGRTREQYSSWWLKSACVVVVARSRSGRALRGGRRND